MLTDLNDFLGGALGVALILAWFAVVFWGAAKLVIQAKRTNDWGKVGIAAVSAATFAGPLLFFIDATFEGAAHTGGLGFMLAMLSALAIIFHSR